MIPPPSWQIVRTFDRSCLVRHPYCGHLCMSDGRTCAEDPRRGADGWSDRIGRIWLKIFDWPLGGVALPVQAANDWLAAQSLPTTVHRLQGGGLAFGAGTSIHEIVEPPDWEHGYRVIGDDGSFPTWWPILNTAVRMAQIRQRIRALPCYEGCWIVRKRKSDNYSQFDAGRDAFAALGYSSQGRTRMRGHVASYIAFHGRRPQNTLDHKCRVPQCVRPDHLENVPSAENYRRARAPIPPRAQRIRDTLKAEGAK